MINFDISGRMVWKNSKMSYQLGVHSIQWHGYNSMQQAVSSGVYLIKLITDNTTHTQKMVLLK